MKKFILSVGFVGCAMVMFAQQDAQFTQNMFNKLGVNPGAAGANGGICGTILSRTQWMGFEGHPTTHLFSGDARFNSHGVGLTVFQDKLGVEKSFAGKLAYSYHLQLGPGDLGIGLEAGLLNKSFGDGWISVDPFTSDPSIPNTSTSDMTFDLGAGLYYSIENQLYVGISALHLPQSTLTATADAGGVGALNYESARHYYLMAGYEWAVNATWVVKPSILAKTDAASTQLDVNAVAVYNNFVWGGVTYRLQDAVAVLAGINLPSPTGLKVGLAYDLTTSSLSNHSSGSVEFMIKYCTTLNLSSKNSVYRSVRFL